MKIRANTVDLGSSIFLALWQVASLPFVHRDWVKGERVSAVVDYLLPTVQLAFGLAAASKARGRSVGWGALAVIGPAGVPAVYRWPLHAIPLAEANPPPPPQSSVIEFAVVAAQVIIVVHSVATYPWDKRYQWAGDLFCYCFVSMAMMPSLSRTLTDRGYSSTWALLAPLGPAGLVVVYLLPDCHARPARGFQVESSTPPAD